MGARAVKPLNEMTNPMDEEQLVEAIFERIAPHCQSEFDAREAAEAALAVAKG